MNAHDKTQLAFARINCALKDSSCDSPSSKIFKFTILVSNASSCLTKVLKCPLTRMIPYSHTISLQIITGSPIQSASRRTSLASQIGLIEGIGLKIKASRRCEGPFDESPTTFGEQGFVR
ncbi:hypothetical protein H5410_021136 [Solanum commersonii]|uniref:Uncharacterized protein n=1 Tax=Solanum commersonii TaxID=4109 RepID=A0A9J5ZD48_SOLCO|nr:hypothetical protein H5410_021136 [Solanum commersonii]